MSSSVSAMLVTAAPQFRGDAEGLLDALVAACAAQPQLGKVTERELQPYFETNATPSSVASTRSPSTSHDFASLEIVIKKASKRRPSPPNPARPDAPTQQLPSNGRKQRCSTGPTPSPSKGLYVNVQRMPRTEPSLSIAPLATPPVSATRAAATAGSHFACPAMFSSPKPEALPMPTSSLLLRANRVVSVAAM
ncbi:hypothetical protein V8C86DRAFT_151003 [Haematococcus lacustris]